MLTITAQEFAERRQRVLASIAPDAIVILAAATVSARNRDVEYSFRQESNFQYLTGFPEPEAVMVLAPGRTEGQYILFCRDKDPIQEVWTGRRVGQLGALNRYGADEAYSINSLAKVLPDLLDGRETVYSLLFESHSAALQVTIKEAVEVLQGRIRQGAKPPQAFANIAPLLHDMRLIKSPAELAIMQYAMDVSAQAHVRAMQECQVGLSEYHLEAALEYEFRRGGARLVAYNSIVASGDNGCILHYQENNAPLIAGDMVMIDAGCEIDCYASDISRSFPVSGVFSPEQKALYEIVLAANRAAIEQVAPGNTYQSIHDVAVRVITQGLVDLGILEGDVDSLIADKAFFSFYMHNTGHWLGLDVHDVGDYRVNGQSRLLAEGMVLTIEPGIYIDSDNEKAPARWRGIGIRIEDNVVVSKEGCVVMTHKAPKTIAEIEALMAAGR